MCGASVGKLKKSYFHILILIGILLCFHGNLHAEAARKQQWYKAADGSFYYINKKGQKSKGLVQINGKKYYFDQNGCQKTGWRKIKSNYYYFTIANGKKGAMAVSTEINGIRLRADGTAKLNSYSREKLPLLWQASQLADQITTPRMSKTQKLQACFAFVRDRYADFQMGGFRKSARWDMTYARIGLMANPRSRRADCYVIGCTFAYLANALGFKVYAISSGKHGWAEIGGKIYDPAFARASNKDSFFGMNYNMSGVQGRPNFKGHRNYVKEI